MADTLLIVGFTILLSIAGITFVAFLVWLLHKAIRGIVQEIRTGTTESRLNMLVAVLVIGLIVSAIIMMIVGLLLGGTIR